jgi:hypothetical protein
MSTDERLNEKYYKKEIQSLTDQLTKLKSENEALKVKHDELWALHLKRLDELKEQITANAQLSKKQELLDEMAVAMERLIRNPENCFARNAAKETLTEFDRFKKGGSGE